MQTHSALPVREAGFTILEVLVAFVLLAVTLAVVLQVFSAGLRDAQLADEYARAVMIARSRLAGFSAAERLEVGLSSGQDGPFEWTLSATDYDESQEQPEAQAQVKVELRVRLLRVESKVAWRAADGRNRNLHLSTLELVSRQ